MKRLQPYHSMLALAAHSMAQQMPDTPMEIKMQGAEYKHPEELLDVAKDEWEQWRDNQPTSYCDPLDSDVGSLWFQKNLRLDKPRHPSRPTNRGHGSNLRAVHKRKAKARAARRR